MADVADMNATAARSAITALSAATSDVAVMAAVADVGAGREAEIEFASHLIRFAEGWRG